MADHTYSGAQGATIAASTKVIRIIDRGLAAFERVQAEPPHAGKLRSADRYLPDGSTDSANGGWWELSRSQRITPKMVGAQGWDPPAGFSTNNLTATETAGCPNDAVALQTFFDLVFEQDYHGDASGVYGTGTTINAGPASTRGSHAGSIGGAMRLFALAGMSAVLNLRNVVGWTWDGSIEIGGRGPWDWSGRVVDYGITMSGNTMGFTISGALNFSTLAITGIRLRTATGEAAEWFTCPMISGYAVGSGPIPGVANGALRSSFSNAANQVGAYDTNQWTRLDVSTLPPAALDENMPYYCVINDRVYQVVNVDRANSKIGIYPWLETAAGTTGELDYLFGAVVEEGGSDGSLVNIGEIGGTNVSAPYKTDCLYPGRIGSICAQACTAAVIFNGQGTFAMGGVVGQVYSEISKFDLIAFAAPYGNTKNVIENLITDSQADNLFAKFALPTRWNGTPSVAPQDSGLGELKILMVAGSTFHATPRRRDGLVAARTDGRTEPLVLYANQCTISAVAFDKGLYGIMGVNTLEVLVVGTGANGQPTGTITFGAPAGKQINGKSAETYSNLAQPLHVVLCTDPATGNLTAIRVRSLGPKGAAVPAPSGGTTVDAEARTAIGSLISRLQAADVIA